MDPSLTLLGQVVVASAALFVPLLAWMARRRGLSPIGWGVAGLLFPINIIAAFVLLFIRHKGSARRYRSIGTKATPRFLGSIFLAISLSTVLLAGLGALAAPPSFLELRWGERAARTFAREAVSSGTPFLYASGDYVCSPIGIEREDWELVRGLPKESSLCGLVGSSRDERIRAKIQYAHTFNSEVVRLMRAVREN